MVALRVALFWLALAVPAWGQFSLKAEWAPLHANGANLSAETVEIRWEIRQGSKQWQKTQYVYSDANPVYDPLTGLFVVSHWDVYGGGAVQEFEHFNDNGGYEFRIKWLISQHTGPAGHNPWNTLYIVDGVTPWKYRAAPGDDTYELKQTIPINIYGPF